MEMLPLACPLKLLPRMVHPDIYNLCVQIHTLFIEGEIRKTTTDVNGAYRVRALKVLFTLHAYTFRIVCMFW